MSIETILAEIDAEIARLTQVRSLLASTGKVGAKLAAVKAAKTPKTRKKRVLSPEARKRIADGQKKRWAAVRATARKGA
ncbi:MAG TPA: hypothetical protein VE291_10390 [Terracidiphilus sp.]|jgi:hypothetical protein|nr:hypothetical protein [Terracidiphilus sp.]